MSDSAEKSSRKIIVAVVIGLMAVVGFFYVQTNANGVEPAAEADAAEETGSNGEAAGEGENDEAPAPVPVEVTVAEQGSIASYLSATANLVAEDEVRVIAEVEGRVVDLRVEEGDWVEKGQILARLDRQEAQIALDKAQARAANALTVFERGETMREQELISSEQIDLLTMEHRVAQQEVAEAEWRLTRFTIRAPFAGRITQRMLTVGQRVKPNDEAFALADFDPLVARIYLPEKDVVGLEEGREVEISLAAASDVRFAGRIRQISPVVDVTTGTVKITIEAMEPPSQVRPGGFVSIDIVRERRDDVVVLPRDAVIRELRSAHVFVVEGDVASEREVELGLEEGTRVQVVSGLEPGEEVVIAGQGGLEDGALVKKIDGSKA